MPEWAQIFFAVFPIGVLILGAVFWVVRRLAHLEGEVHAILVLLGVFVKVKEPGDRDRVKTTL